MSKRTEMPPKPMTPHAVTTKALLQHAVAQGWTLEYCSTQKIMNRKRRTLEGYARRFNLTFPDYTPRKLKPKKQRKAKKDET